MSGAISVGGRHKEIRNKSIHRLPQSVTLVRDSLPLFLDAPPPKHQRGIGATEAEAVGHDRIQRLFQGLSHQGQALGRRVRPVEVGRGGDEAVLHHQQAMDGFLDPGRAERVAAEGLGGADEGDAVAEDRADRPQLGGVADRRRGAVGVQVVHRPVDRGQGLLHAAHRALPRGRDHVVAVGGGAVADELGVDVGPSGQGVLELLEHQHAAAAGDDEAVAGHVKGAGRHLGGRVVAAGQGPHGVEQHGQGPALLLAAAGEHHVLLAPADQLRGMADAVGAGGAGRGHRVADAVDAEGRGQAGGHGAAHGARHHERADAPDPAGPQDVGGLDLVDAGGPARAGDQPDPRVRKVAGLEAGLGQGLLHRQVGVGGGIAHEAPDPPVDVRLQVDRRAAADLAPHPHLGIAWIEADAGPAGLQAAGDLPHRVPQAGDDAPAGDHYPSFASHASEPLRDREQTDPEILGHVDGAAVHGHRAVGDAHHQSALDHPLDLQVVLQAAGGGLFGRGEVGTVSG